MGAMIQMPQCTTDTGSRGSRAVKARERNRVSSTEARAREHDASRRVSTSRGGHISEEQAEGATYSWSSSWRHRRATDEPPFSPLQHQQQHQFTKKPQGNKTPTCSLTPLQLTSKNPTQAPSRRITEPPTPTHAQAHSHEQHNQKTICSITLHQ